VIDISNKKYLFSFLEKEAKSGGSQEKDTQQFLLLMKGSVPPS
jgi:hypothetical protein